MIAPQTTTNGAAVNTTGGAMASYAAANATVMTNSQVKFLAGESVKANANTVFILWNAKNETYVYEGIENAPTVKTGTSTDDGDTNTVLVNYIQKNGYATYVFIDTSRDADAQIDDVNNVADYLFILKPTNNKTVVGEETYYQYKVLFDGEETTKYIEQDIVGSDAQGIMVYNVKANDKDYITSATLFEDHDPSQGGTKDIHEVTEMDIADGDTLTQSGKTISITGDLLGTSTAANREYIVDNDTVLNLIVGKGCALLKDAGANYELYQNLSASGLAGLVKGYALDGTVFAVTDDGNSDVLDYLYVYVEQAKEIEPPSKDAKFTDLKFKDLDVEEATGNLDYQVTIPAGENDSTKTTSYTLSAGATLTSARWYATEAAALADTTNTAGSPWDLTHAQPLPAQDFYVKLTATAADGETTNTILVKVTVLGASAGTLTSSNSAVVITNTSTITIDKVFSGTVTVADLYSCLSVTGGSAYDTIQVKTAFGTVLDETSNIAVVAGMQVVFTPDGGTAQTRTIAFSA